jgi:hypothetical protein
MGIQEKMFEEIRNNKLFNLANDYGLEYLSKISDRNVYPNETDIGNLTVFDEDLADNPSSAEDVLVLLNKFGGPATVAQVGGRYFGFVNGGVVPAGLVARLLSDFWDQNTAMQVISPISAKLEIVVQKWLRRLFGLHETCVAGFVSGTSMATFCGLAAARYRILKRNGWDINDSGLNGAPKIRVVAGRHAHSTVIKAVSLLGFGKNNIEWLDTLIQMIRVESFPKNYQAWMKVQS